MHRNKIQKLARTKRLRVDWLRDHLDELAESDNAIVILAPRLSAAKAKKLVAKAKVEYKFDTTASARERAI